MPGQPTPGRARSDTAFVKAGTVGEQVGAPDRGSETRTQTQLDSMVEQGLGGRAAAIAEGLVDAGKPAEARSFLDRPTDKVPDSLRKAEVLADADSTMLASLDDQHARVEWMTAIAERMADDGLPDDALAVLTEAVAVSDRGDIAGVAEAAARIGGDAAVLHLIQRSWGLGLISRSGGCTLAIDGSAC